MGLEQKLAVGIVPAVVFSFAVDMLKIYLNCKLSFVKHLFFRVAHRRKYAKCCGYMVRCSSSYVRKQDGVKIGIMFCDNGFFGIVGLCYIYIYI